MDWLFWIISTRISSLAELLCYKKCGCTLRVLFIICTCYFTMQIIHDLKGCVESHQSRGIAGCSLNPQYTQIKVDRSSWPHQVSKSVVAHKRSVKHRSSNRYSSKVKTTYLESTDVSQLFGQLEDVVVADIKGSQAAQRTDWKWQFT